jgi:signal transduction histidine kinase
MRPQDEPTSPVATAGGTLSDRTAPIQALGPAPSGAGAGRPAWPRPSPLLAEVAVALAGADPTQAALGACVASLVRHQGAALARVWTLEPGGRVLRLRASAGLSRSLAGRYSRIAVGSLLVGRVAQAAAPLLNQDLPHDPRLAEPDWAAGEGLTSFAGCPLVAEGRAVGVVALFADHPLPAAGLADLAAVADLLAQFLERRRAAESLTEGERRVRRAQGLETVGLLAAGVLHDLNNLLAPIAGYADLLLAQPPGADAQEELRQIQSTARRAVALSQRLLDVGRARPPQPRPVDVNALLADLEGLVRRLVGPAVKVELCRGAGLWPARADPAGLERLVLNLAANARDAMPGGGRLTLETANAEVGEAHAQGLPAARAGRYVLVSVRDTGVGMDEETRGRLFEPFFTTKGEGGTGLGLTAAQEVVGQVGGFLSVWSEPGAGSSFRVYLPRAEGGSGR